MTKEEDTTGEEALKKKLVKNACKCLVCNTVIESTYRWDFKWCPCHSVAVDGGRSYIRRIGYPENMQDMSVWE